MKHTQAYWTDGKEIVTIIHQGPNVAECRRPNGQTLLAHPTKDLAPIFPGGDVRPTHQPHEEEDPERWDGLS